MTGAAVLAATSTSGRGRVRRLSLARAVSFAGTQAAQVALVYQVYADTRSATWVAITVGGTAAIGGAMAPVSGWAADRFDRRLVMSLSEMASGVVYVALVFVSQPALLVLLALTATLIGSPFRAASAAAIPNLVAAAELPWANAQLAASANAALVGGPLAGGAILSTAGVGAVFAINAATFLVSGGLTLSVRGRFSKASHHDERPRAWKPAFKGFVVLASNKLLLSIATASALSYAAFGMVLIVDPLLARHYHAGPVGYGLLTTVWGVGSTLGAIIAGRTVTARRAPAAVAWGTAAMACSLGSIAALPGFWMIVSVGTIGGTGAGFVFVPWILLIQTHTPDETRGRAVAAADALDQVFFLAGMGVAVPAVIATGPHHVYALVGIILALATVVALRTLTSRSRLDDSAVDQLGHAVRG